MGVYVKGGSPLFELKIWGTPELACGMQNRMNPKFWGGVENGASISKYDTGSSLGNSPRPHITSTNIVIRYVLPPGPCSRAVPYIHAYDKAHDGRDGQHTSEVLNFLKEDGMDIANCRGQSYDNASNISGRYNVQAIVKRECKYAVFCSMQQPQSEPGRRPLRPGC